MTDRSEMVDAVADDALGGDDACGLLERIARREVSPGELREAAITRARDANTALNAVAWWVDDDSAIGVDPAAPLSGIPTVIKDNEALRGYVTTEGSRAVAERPAEANSPWVAQYLGMGVVPIAKTTLPEFGLTATTESLRFGITRNPWSLGHSCGGSSGGSAALVAAGAVPIAHANDGGGSIRIPASCCGLVGMKPSRGRIIDIPELDDLPVNLVCQGVVTRSVRDTALYLAAAERAYRPAGLPPVGHVTSPDGQRLRIAMVRSATRGLPLSPESVAAVDRAASLCEGLGHHVEEIPVPVGDDFGPDFLRYWAFLSFTVKVAGSRLFGPGFDRRRTEPLTTALARLFVREAERVPGSLRRLKRLAQGPDATFTRFDVVLTPTLGKPPVPIGYLGPEVDPRTHMARLLGYTSFTPLQNVTGQPAISLPLGRSTEGLPVGVQFVAGRGHERVLLSLALELEQAAPWPTRVGHQAPV